VLLSSRVAYFLMLVDFTFVSVPCSFSVITGYLLEVKL